MINIDINTTTSTTETEDTEMTDIVISNSKTSVRKSTFPYNLLSYIRDINQDFVFPQIITQDITDGVHYAILTLNEKQRSVLYFRFECQLTLDEISTRLCLSKTRIRNIINIAISTWFKTDNIKFIEHGMKGHVEYLVNVKTNASTNVSMVREYKRGFEDGYNEARGKSTSDDKKHNFMMIEELNLSVRSYNCLKRAGIDTVEDMITRTEKDMIRVRNLGKTGIDEIKSKLLEMGLSFRESDIVSLNP